MYKALIIEDELKLQEALFLMLQQTVPDKVIVAGMAETKNHAIQLIDTLQPDLLFMDIHLKDGTGFEVLEAVQYRDFHLIFTTAYEEHAIRAFKHDAVGYLLKPIDPDELIISIDKINSLRKKFAGVTHPELFEKPFSTVPDRISLPTVDGKHIVLLSDIVRCETSGSYTTFHLIGSRKIMVSKPLKYYDDILRPPKFFRIHQSHTVNLDFVSSYSNDGLLMLKDKTELPLAQRKKSDFFKLLRD
jgi:two-component system LytT family response regulator